MLAVFSGQSGKAQALDPPAMQCLQVQTNGNVVISWIPTTDPFGSFLQYNIYAAPFIDAPYTLIGTVGAINATFFIDTSGAGGVDFVYYYVTTEYDDGSTAVQSAGSDTTSTIYLTAVPSSLPQGYAALDWNMPFDGNFVPPTGTEYKVWMEYPAGNWNIIQTLPYAVTFWNYEISYCNEALNFKIEMIYPGYCNYISNIAGDIFQDVLPPAIPVVTSVSIDHTTNDAIISWEQNPSGDTDGYIVYQCTDPGLDILDTVQGITNTQFIDYLAATTLGPVCYLLAATDTCLSGFPPSPNTSPTSSTCNCSVFLPSIAYGICDDFIQFNWTAYTGWEDGVESYIIHHAFFTGTPPPPGSIVFTPLDTIPGTELSFTHLSISYDGYNVYYIEAVGAVNNYRAQSNIQAVSTPYPVPPDYVYLASASVTNPNEITVNLEIDPTVTEHYFTLEKFDTEGGYWDDVITESATNMASLDIIDTYPTTDVFSYQYRVITENICADVVDTTNLGISILMQGFASPSQLKNILTWSNYGNWENGVQAYKIHRRIGLTGPDVVVAIVSPLVNTYEDDVATLLYTDGKFCYTIEAVENPSTLLNISHSAFSNEVCVSQEPKIWIPTAFVVDGFNSTFKPIISFADFEKYEMTIFNRWGDVVYTTFDINAPWDGTMNGKLVQEGEYAYFISVEDGKGRAYEQAGHVFMLTARDR